MGEIINFVPRPNPNREEQMIKEARKIYEAIFPPEYREQDVVLTPDGEVKFVDTAPSEYVAPSDDCA